MNVLRLALDGGIDSMRTRLTWAGGFVWLFAALLVLGGGPAAAGRRKAASPAPAARTPAAAQHNAAVPGLAVTPAVTKPWALSVPCTPPATDLTQLTDRTVLGASSVDGAGDVNNDGFADVIVGAESVPSPNRGSAYLYLGSPNGLEATPAWTGNPGQGITDTNFYGAGVAGVGDVNGDGYDDVVVGAPDFRFPDDPEQGGPNDAGRAFLYLGGEGGLSQTPAWTADAEDHFGAGFRADFGQFVEGVGDVTGDGVPDVLISDYNWGFGDGVNPYLRTGVAYLYKGGGGLSGAPVWREQGNENFQFFGTGLAGLGDVDGDGIGDFAVSGDGRAGGISGAGRVTIYKGGSLTPIWTLQGTATTHVGVQIAAAGDVNGDGLRDLMVSSASTTFTGQVSIYCGSSSTISHVPCWFSTGPSPYGRLVSGPGDVSGDGYDDILFSDNLYRVLVVRGSPVFPLPPPVQVLDGTLSSTSAERLIAGAGDVDGDGGLDAVTAPSGHVIVWKGTKTHTEIIDPACSEDGFCNGEYLVDSPNGFVLDDDVSRLAAAPVHRIGTVTDGVSLLLLRRVSSTPVTFSLKKLDGSPVGEGWGALSTRTGQNPGSEITITPEPADGCQYAFAVYTPPINFPGTEEQVGSPLQFLVDITDASGLHELQVIALRPPPFVLLHGVWSGPDVWQAPNGGLLKYLSDRGFPSCGAGCLANYGCDPDLFQPECDPAPSFDPRADDHKAIDSLRMAANASLRSMRNQGIADSMVDVVGHSEGGLVARALVASKNYRWKGNYGKGYFHKLITIGSPHRGTALADFLLDHACSLTPLTSKFGGETLLDWFEDHHQRVSEAVVGFQTESTMLEHLGQTDVPTHPIVGIEPVPEPFNGAEFKLNFFLRTIGSFETLDTIMHEATPDGDGTHDTIVPRLSQMGDIPVASVPMQGIVHADLGFKFSDVTETNSEAVWQNVKNLLLRPIDDGLEDGFDSVPAYHRPHAQQDPRSVPTCPEFLRTNPQPSSAEADLDPPPGTVVHPGDIVNLVLTVTGGDPVDGAVFSIGQGFEIVPGPGPQTLPFTISVDRAGRVDIHAVTYGPNETYSADTWVQVETATDPESIEAYPGLVNFTLAGQTVPLTVRGLFAGGPPVDMTSSTAGTIYTVESGTANVITVSAEGLVTAVGSGSDKVIVTHGTLTKQVTVNVLITNLPPAILVQQQINLVTGNVLDVPVTSTDPEAQHVTLTADDLPAFASFTDAGNGTGTLHLAPSAADIGTYTVYVAGVDAGAPALFAGAEVTIVVEPPPPPTVVSVSPGTGFNNDPTPITITGTLFQATPQVYLGTAAQPQKYSLSPVTFISQTELHVTVPVNLVSGLYRLTVVNPDAGIGALNDAFTMAAPGPTMYIGNPTTNQLTRLNLADGGVLPPVSVTAQDVPVDVAVNRTANRGVIAMWGDNQPGKLGIMSLNPATVTGRIDVPGAAQGRTPRAVAIHPSGNPAYVLTADPLFYPSIQQLSRYDFNSGAFTSTLSLGNMHWIEAADLQVSPDGQRLYATNVGDDTLSVIRTSDFAEIARITVGDSPVGIGVSPDSTRVYVTNSDASTISVVNATTLTNIGTINVSNQGMWTGPTHVVVSPDGANLYVAFSSLYNVSTVNVSSGSITQTLSEGGQYRKAAYVPSLGKLYALDFSSPSVKRLNPSTLQVESTWSAGPYVYLYGMDWAEATAPTISSVIPNTVCKLGGTSVTITGSAFQGQVWDGILQVQQRTRVFLSGVEVYATFVDSTHLQFTAPAHANGYVNVEVRNPNGLSSTLTNGLRFQFCQQ
jgi:YVTN family beta-propeller protein